MWKTHEETLEKQIYQYIYFFATSIFIQWKCNYFKYHRDVWSPMVDVEWRGHDDGYGISIWPYYPGIMLFQR